MNIYHTYTIEAWYSATHGVWFAVVVWDDKTTCHHTMHGETRDKAIGKLQRYIERNPSHTVRTTYGQTITQDHFAMPQVQE